MADDQAREPIPKDDADGGGGDASTRPAAPDDEVAASVIERFPDVVFFRSHTQPVLHVTRARWHDVAQSLRDDESFDQCLDITGVDHLVDPSRLVPPGVDPERFELVTNYLSHARNRRIRCIAQVPADDPSIASLVDLFPGLSFAERETYDLFGIHFDGHADLTRILMPDDWVGHPLRKDDAPARVPVTFKEDPSPR